jgi:hypothetical protein
MSQYNLKQKWPNHFTWYQVNEIIKSQLVNQGFQFKKKISCIDVPFLPAGFLKSNLKKTDEDMLVMKNHVLNREPGQI